MDETDGFPLLSLFSGAGGLDLGFEQAGFRPLLALDIDPEAISTYNWNRRESNRCAMLADLSQVSAQSLLKWWEEHAGGVRPAGIIGGPACQAFSVSNVHQLEDDPRAKLPQAYANILKAFNDKHRIEFFLFENVAGLGHKRHAPSLDVFLKAFDSAGFQTRRFYLDAAGFGVPQYRKRMFIVGFNREQYPNLDFKAPEPNDTLVTVRQAIGHLREPLKYKHGTSPAEYGLHPNHWCMNPRSEKFKDGTLKAGEMRGRSFRRLRWDDPSWTVAYGHREVHVHPNGERRLSVFEAMILQGFPPTYELRGSLSGQIRLVSDAVPPPLARALAASIAIVRNRYICARPTGGSQRASRGAGAPSLT